MRPEGFLKTLSPEVLAQCCIAHPELLANDPDHSLRAAPGSESAQLKSCVNCKYRRRKFWMAPCVTCSMISVFMDDTQIALNWLPNAASQPKEMTDEK
jgi:O-succinylbenzoate synthase